LQIEVQALVKKTRKKFLNKVLVILVALELDYLKLMVLLRKWEGVLKYLIEREVGPNLYLS